MKNKLMLFSCIFVLLLSSSGFAADGYDVGGLLDGLYLRGNIGSSILNNSKLTSTAVPGVEVDTEFDTGLDLSVALGSYSQNYSRVELEVGYCSYDIDNFQTSGGTVSGAGDVTMYRFLLNGFIDIKSDWAISPYIGGGFGIAKIEIENVSVAGISIPGGADDTVFAYQFGAGIGYPINDKITADLGYRYFATEDPDFGGVDAEYDSHNFMIGIRYVL